jgi:Bacterial PH domain/Short C-terminal domain
VIVQIDVLKGAIAMARDPAHQIEDLAKKKLNVRLGVGKELKTLPTHLQEGEQVLNLSGGMYDGANGLVVLTDRRVIFFSAGMLKTHFEDFPYSKISSVQHRGAMMFGEITIFSSGNKAELKQMIKDRAKEIAEYIRGRISEESTAGSTPGAQPSTETAKTNDPFEKLRKLAELRDAGVVSEDEFEKKKKELLETL